MSHKEYKAYCGHCGRVVSRGYGAAEVQKAFDSHMTEHFAKEWGKETRDERPYW